MSNKVTTPNKYKTPEALRQAADAYFEWCDTHPIRGQRTVKTEDGEKVTRDDQYPRPYTFEGLGIYIGIMDWAKYVQAHSEKPGYGDVFAYIRAKVRMCQIEGSLVGLYREGLTARLNGIADNMNITEVAPQSTIEKTYDE